jgi:FkbM family methyltransferase
VSFVLNEKRSGTFLEFGATNGVELSNSLLLEKEFGWKGVLAEPSPQWHAALMQNRPDATILTDCIYSETGKNVDFFVSEVGVLSSLEEFKNHDASSMPGNAQARNRNGYTVSVPTISLNDVFVRYLDSAPIDYMSVDTEGSELLILENFDFGKFGPRIVSVEHNFSDSEAMLDELFQHNGYERYFREQTQFDAWYVRKV